jgi:4-hydroxy-tetrahydrodipicolinate synthase
MALVCSAGQQCLLIDMKNPSLTGTLTALVTPFTKQKVDFDDLDKLVEFQIKGGIDGLVPMGTTGESPTLNHEEHMDVVRATVARSNGRVPVIAGTGSNSTREAISSTKLAHEAGVDGMLVVAPYYNKPSPEGLFQHFSAIAEATDRPIILYSIPGRCGIEIGVDVVVRLRAKYSHVRHIKEAGGSVDRVDQIKNALGNDITVLSGDDGLTLPFMAAGAEGVISVASNLLVKDIVQMVSAAQKNDFRKAAKAHRKLNAVFKALFLEPNPVPVKFAMQRAGIIKSAAVRLPLCASSKANQKILVQALEAIGR